MLFLNTVQVYILFFIHQIDSHDDIKPRIVEGKPCTVKNYPFYVTILIPDATVCGGTLVTLQWIITAAHCFAKNFHHSRLLVRAGFDEDLTSPNIQFRSISNIIIHPKFHKKHVAVFTPEVRNDIAVVRLTEPFNKSEVVDIVVFPTEGYVKNCSKVVAVGVGYNHTVIMDRLYEDADKRPLHCATLKLVTTAVCQKSWPGGTVIDDSVLCTQQPGNTDPCYGDSGGPLVCNQHTVVGIVSSGYGCGMPTATVYVNVEAFLPFIYKALDPSYKIPKKRSNKNSNKKKSTNGVEIFITSPINPMLIICTVYYNYICYLLE